MFVYQRGRNPAGDVALDDITVIPGGCYLGPSIDPPDNDSGNLKAFLSFFTHADNNYLERIRFSFIFSAAVFSARFCLTTHFITIV